MTYRNSALLLPLLAAVLSLVAPQVSAHHSFAMFNRDKVTTVEGVVSQFAWTNPHVFIDIDASEKQGKVVRYKIEAASVNMLMRQGWKIGAIKAGDHLKVIFNPLKSGLPGGLLIEAILPNGTTLKG